MKYSISENNFQAEEAWKKERVWMWQVSHCVLKIHKEREQSEREQMKSWKVKIIQNFLAPFPFIIRVLILIKDRAPPETAGPQI